MTHAVRCCLALSLFAAGCVSSSTTEPDPPPTPTRIIRLGGNMNFGNVAFFAVREDGVLTVSNDGDDNLQINGMSYLTTLPNSGTAPNLRGWCFEMLRPMSTVNFAVAPGQTVSVGWRFAPVFDPARGMVPRPPDFQFNCSGTLTVNGNQTSGTNTIAVTVVAAP